MAFTLRGKTAIVTGAGSGISFAFAKLLVDRECNVVIGDLSLRPEAQTLVDENQSSPRVTFHKTDVTDWTQLSELFARAVSEFGGFDIVCPGAGVYEPLWSNFWHPPGAANSLSKDSPDGLGHYALFDINLAHPIRATQLALAEFLTPSKYGTRASRTNLKHVVHISSVASQAAALTTPMYVATKHALSAFVRSLGPLEATLGVRVTAVAPGLVRTSLWTDNPEKLKLVDQTRDQWITPEDTAAAMLKLVESPEVTGGTCLEVLFERTRVIPLLGNKGPTGEGLIASNEATGIAEVYETLAGEGWGKPGG